MTDEQRLEVALIHIRRAFFELPRRIAPEMAEQGYWARRIQNALRFFLRRKHANLDMPEHLTCPIRLHVFYQPVVASDGATYEYASICRQFANIQRFPGGRGFTGEAFRNKFLTKNLAMAAQCAEFRDAHRMAEIKHFDINAKYLAAPAQAAAAVAAVAPVTAVAVVAVAAAAVAVAVAVAIAVAAAAAAAAAA